MKNFYVKSVPKSSLPKKKKLKCKNKQCDTVCHIKCDQAIQNSSVAMTVDSYYCKSCRDDGDSIVFKKEHATRGRSKSPSLVHISESSNKELAALRNVSPPKHESPQWLHDQKICPLVMTLL